MQRINQGPDQEVIDAKTKMIFDRLDTDKSGFLEMDEFKILLVQMTEIMGFGALNQELYDELKERFDRNQDGKISFNELTYFVRETFNGLNKFNANKKVEIPKLEEILSEKQKFHKKIEEKSKIMFEKLDVDKSGFLEKLELKVLIEKIFEFLKIPLNFADDALQSLLKQFDENQDGKISLEELQKLLKKTFEDIEKVNEFTNQMNDSKQTKKLTEYEKMELEWKEMATKAIKKYDTNFDGLLDKQEFKILFNDLNKAMGQSECPFEEVWEEIIGEFDENSDKKISKEELWKLVRNMTDSFKKVLK